MRWPTFQLIARCCFAVGVCLATTAPIAIAAHDESGVRLPDGTALHEIDFERHVLPLITRYGCNAAACHGSFQGRGGFRLSLFGHAPRKDFDELLDRVDEDSPNESLLLTKPSLRTEHGGGRRFAVDSWPYQVLAAWIYQGAHASAAGTSIDRITVTPAAVCLSGPDASRNLEVRASFKGLSDGTATSFCRFESRDPGVAEVTAEGKVKAIRPGATTIIVSYAGGFASVPVIVPYPNEPAHAEVASGDATQVANKEPMLIDRMIGVQLAQLNLPPSSLADDATFLRRVTLDTVGRLPTSDELRQFLDSHDEQKRCVVIDRLLSDSQHGSLWATRMCDLTGCRLESMEGPDQLKPFRARLWHEWFRRRLIDNVPWDRVVREVIGGTSRDGLSVDKYIDRETALIRSVQSGGTGDYALRHSLDLFYRRSSPGGIYPHEALAERVAAAFLGVRIQCARCHKHPYDRWTQGDYAAFVNVFANVTFGSSTELNQAVLKRLAEQRRQREAGQSTPPLPRVQEVYNDPAQAQRLPDPDQKGTAHPRPLGGPELTSAADPRAALADWLVKPDNPWFARNWVNRIWAHYFGRGLVEPVDGFSVANPPTHPELLDCLAEEFVRSNYDLRRIERLILTSATYQRTGVPPREVSGADRYYACATVRPMMAEAFVASLHQVLKYPNPWTSDLPPAGTLLDVASDRPTDARLAYLFELFGRGTRESVCDCDRRAEPSLRQTLHLMSDTEWIEQIQKSPLISELLAQKDDKLAVRSAIVQTLSRIPTAAEEDLLLDHLRAVNDRKAAWTDIVWALVNSKEFRTNH